MKTLLSIIFALGLYSCSNIGLPIIETDVVALNLPHNVEKPIPTVASEDLIAFNWTAKNKDLETRCLAENIYFEGRGESTQGQIAIGLVTINRVKSSQFPNTICKVVFQITRSRSGKTVAQFSWTNDKHSNIAPKKTATWKKIFALSQAMTAEGTLSNFSDFTNGAMYYHATRIDPRWTNLTRLAEIGQHRFYRDPNNTVAYNF